jgi:hypothetical protein
MSREKGKGPWRLVKRIAIIVAGSVVTLVGIAMLVLPGPAIIVIPLGVSILSTEVPMARRWMDKAKEWVRKKKRELATRRAMKRLKSALHGHGSRKM